MYTALVLELTELCKNIKAHVPGFSHVLINSSYRVWLSGGMATTDSSEVPDEDIDGHFCGWTFSTSWPGIEAVVSSHLRGDLDKDSIISYCVKRNGKTVEVALHNDSPLYPERVELIKPLTYQERISRRERLQLEINAEKERKRTAESKRRLQAEVTRIEYELNKLELGYADEEPINTWEASRRTTYLTKRLAYYLDAWNNNNYSPRDYDEVAKPLRSKTLKHVLEAQRKRKEEAELERRRYEYNQEQARLRRQEAREQARWEREQQAAYQKAIEEITPIQALFALLGFLSMSLGPVALFILLLL